MVEDLIARIPEAAVLAPLLGFLAGALLSLSPVSLPSVPVVVSALGPGTVATEDRPRRRLLTALPAVLAFVAGMDGVLGMVGATIVEFAEFLTRAAIVLHPTTARTPRLMRGSPGA